MRVRLGLLFPFVYFLVMVCNPGGLDILLEGKDVGLAVAAFIGFLLGLVIDAEQGTKLGSIYGDLGLFSGILLGSLLAHSTSTGFIHWLLIVGLYGWMGLAAGKNIVGGFVGFVRGIGR